MGHQTVHARASTRPSWERRISVWRSKRRRVQVPTHVKAARRSLRCAAILTTLFASISYCGLASAAQTGSWWNCREAALLEPSRIKGQSLLLSFENARGLFTEGGRQAVAPRLLFAALARVDEQRRGICSSDSIMRKTSSARLRLRVAISAPEIKSESRIRCANSSPAPAISISPPAVSNRGFTQTAAPGRTARTEGWPVVHRRPRRLRQVPPRGR